MSRLTSLKRLVFAALVTAGVVAACRAAQPGEAPPLAPRPEIGPPTSPAPVPGAPDPLPGPGTPGPNTPAEDAGVAPPPPVSQIDPPVYQAFDTPITPLQAGDAGVAGPDAGGGRDAGPRLDAAIPDGPASPDAPTDAPMLDAPPARRDAAVPDARDGGVGLPPVPDASLPPDAVRPMH